MENDIVDFTLPEAPRGLCFDRNDFINSTFSVDCFLAEHQNATSLESMRDDLGVYLKVLRLAMIELINKDYANFVNLCATLIGFDKTILKIQVPLELLNEEVLGVKQSLDEAMKELSMWLNQRHTLLKKKLLLKHYSQTINCLKILENILNNISDKNIHDRILLADRASMQYNQIKFSIVKCEPVLKSDQKEQFKKLGEKLINTLNELLFQFWNDSNEEDLLKTLIALSSLDQVTETEMLIRKKAVSPLLQDIISESSLQRNKKGLTSIFNQILNLLNDKLKLLLTVTEHPKLNFLDKKYQFLINCFWCEVESKIEVNLASIFAPGNPQVFYQRYNESMQFICKLEEFCVDNDSVRLMHETPEYKSFQKRWNLPVYFQIRFQEIAGGVETALQIKPTLEASERFILRQTDSCWKALQECWSDGVYIEALGHKFWKLSLQIISRYASWCVASCERTSLPSEPINVNKTFIDHSITTIIDTNVLLQRLPELLQLACNKFNNEKSKELLSASLKFTENNLHSTISKIRDSIVSEVYAFCNIHLKQVSDIPRLYRKTNRNIPTKPCAYIDVISNCLKEFKEEASRSLDKSFLEELLKSLFNVMTTSYYKYVEDVLISVQKTEDSLRRLKQIREQINQPTIDAVTVTDGDKIRLQLNVDILSYGKIGEFMNVDVNSVHKYTELMSMVTETVKNIKIK